MKRTTILSAIAALVIVTLAGCYVGLDDGAGSVGIPLPDPRTVSEGAPAEYARIFILNGAIVLEVGEETPYKEFDLSPSANETLEEATVGPVPAGDGYRVVLVFGNYEEGAGGDEYFVPSDYALSDPFTVYGGQATAVDVELGPTPFDAAGGTLGLNLVGIMWDGDVDGDDLYVATPDELFVGDLGTLNFGSQETLPTGETANSISRGALEGVGPVPWVNTDQGLLPYDTSGGGWQQDFDTGKGFAGAVTDSGAYILGTTLYGYVQFDGGLGGVRDTVGSAEEWMQPADLADLVAGEPIYDLAVQYDSTAPDGGEVYGWFATKLGAFRMPKSLLEDSDMYPDLTVAQEVFERSDFFEIMINGTKAIITDIAVGYDGASTLYLGTPRGAVRVSDLSGFTSDPEPDFELSGELIAGTEGLIVEDIVMVGSYVVVLTNHFVVYSDDDGSTFSDPIPVYASQLGGEVTDMFVVDSALADLAILAGNGGVALLPLN